MIKINTEGLEKDNLYDLHFIIYKGIKEKLDNAIVEREVNQIPLLENLVNWYSKEIILNSKTIKEKLFILKSLK